MGWKEEEVLSDETEKNSEEYEQVVNKIRKVKLYYRKTHLSVHTYFNNTPFQWYVRYRMLFCY